MLDAMETYEVPASYLVKALSPGHAKLVIGELIQHMIDTHTKDGTLALSSVREGTLIDWLDGPLSGGQLDD